MRMRNLARRGITTVFSLAIGAMALAGCDKDDNTPAVPAPQTSNTTPAPAPASMPAATTTATPIRSFNDSFKDVTGPVKPEKVLAQVIQTLPLFNHPTSCTVSLDGKYLFVTNSAVVLNGIEYNKGSISKLEIGADGRLKMIEPAFVKGLHAPMGIAVLPKATAMFHAGALFVAVGTTSGLDDKGQQIDDVTRFNTGIAVVDPASGKSLGVIPLGNKHAVAKALRHAVLAPAGVCFDPLGNLYVTDSGNTGRDLDPPIIGFPGIVRIDNADLDACAQDQLKNTPGFLPVRHVPGAVFYSPADDAIYWTTCDGQAGAGGAIYRCPRRNFPEQTMVNMIAAELGPRMGLAITPNGTLLASGLDGDIVFLNRKVVSAALPFEQEASFSSPADMKMVTLPNGYNILYVPEQEPNSQNRGNQRLRVILLPTSI